jgi:hypothetical protein
LQQLKQRFDELQARYHQLEQNLLHAKLHKSQSMMDFEKTSTSTAASTTEKFTPEQRYIAKVAFEKYDVDGSGTIDHYELKTILEELRYAHCNYSIHRPDYVANDNYNPNNNYYNYYNNYNPNNNCRSCR